MTQLIKPEFSRLDEEQDEEEGDKPAGEMPAGAKVLNNLFKSRTVLVFGEINDKLAREVSTILLALAQENDEDIRILVSSPGGHVESGDVIHDMIRFIKPRVKIIGTGWVASAAAHIFLAADKEDRVCLPNTRFMLHQPSGGAGGRAVDIAIEAKEIVRIRKRINAVISRQTGQPLEKVEQDTDRNFWMSAEEAVEYGLVSKIVESEDEI